MNLRDSIVHGLREHLQLCRSTLALVEREHQALRDPAFIDTARHQNEKKDLLSRLEESLNRVRQLRVEWAGLGRAERARYPDIATLLRQNQDVIMKIVILDRENGQALLRHGLQFPSHRPPLQQPRPLLAENLYPDRLPDRL